MNPGRVQQALLGACQAELSALKPGNVSIYADGHGMRVEDFRRSARAAAPSLCTPGWRVGARVRGAIDATRNRVGCNTNLGIVLLCAPIAHAALGACGPGSLRAALDHTLQALDAEDTRLVYAAIRQARPGGMNSAPRYDIRHGAPPVSLLEAMRPAIEWDRIAFQYVHGYCDVFDFAEPYLRAAQARWHSESWGIVSLYLALLAKFGDSLVRRKHGEAVATGLRAQAERLGGLLEQQPDPESMMGALALFDLTLKQRGINPGTTADLVVATLFVRQLHDDLRAHPHACISMTEAGSGPTSSVSLLAT